MAQFDRLIQYTSIFKRKKLVSKKTLMHELEISEATFKRDLVKMRLFYSYDIVYDRDLDAYKLINENQAFELPGLMFTQKELLEYNALCQVLPGPSSTQTLVAIAYQFGGLTLAILSFLIWILPSAIIMSLFAIGYNYLSLNRHAANFIFVLGPMAIGFIAYSAFILTRNVLGNRLSYGLAIFASVLTLIIRNAYVFPIILACAILFSYFFLKVPEEKKPEDFIIATGKSFSIRDFCNLCLKIIGVNVKWHGKNEHENQCRFG